VTGWRGGRFRWPRTATIADAVRCLRDAAWAPLVVRDGDVVLGIVTAEVIAERLVDVAETA